MTDGYRSVDLLAPAGESDESTPALPPVLAQVRQRRLRMLAYLALFAFGLGTVLTLVIPQVTVPSQPLSPPMLALCGGMSVVAIALLLYLRRGIVDDRRSLIVGQAFVVTAAAAMALTEVLVVPPKHEEISGISGICLWIVMAPLVLLASPRQTFITAFLAASWLPIMYFASPYRESYSIGHLIEWFVPGYFCVGLATVASRSVNRLGQELESAREKLREWSGYRLVRQLAAGGMGQIWLARHRLLPQDAAIKFIIPGRVMSDHSSTIDPKATDYKLFADEARAVASLTSPHTVRIYDFGLADDGRLFLVMEYLFGRDVDDIIELLKEPLPQGRVIFLLQQVCLALEEVHAAGLVHRDIKPSNIMVCRLGGQVDWVKLIDFGLTNEGVDVQEDVVSGTPGFLAPELLLGTGQPTPSSDLYALGSTAWFMLTGKDIFDLNDEDWATTHISKPLPNTLAEMGYDPVLIQIIHDCLAKHPAKRPDSARKVRMVLQELSAQYPWAETEAVQWWESHPLQKSTRERETTDGRSITVLAR